MDSRKSEPRKASPRLGRAIPLLVTSAILLVAWSLVVPIFEAPDEPHHWNYARYIHDHWNLPLYTSSLVEANQPPLYYWLIAPVSAKTELPPPWAWFDANGALREACPPRFYKDCRFGFSRYEPIRWARLITVIISIFTILFTYLSGYEATGSLYTATSAGALAAFLPQFTFRGTNVSNDALVASTSAAATYIIIRLVRRKFSWPTAYLASLFVALAFLSKISAIIFVPVLAGILILEDARWPHRMKRLSVLLLGAIPVLPWLIRNLKLYGDPLASKVMTAVVPMIVDRKSIRSSYFLTTFPTVLAKSFVGVFGWMNVYLPQWVYWLFGFFAVLAAAGCIYGIVHRKLDRRVVIWLATILLLSVLSTAQLNLTFSQPQGRYLFPALTAVAVLAGMGLGAVPGWKRGFAYWLAAFLAVINLYALFGVEWRTYQRPRPTPTFTSLDVRLSPSLISEPAGPLPRGGSFGQTFIARGSNLSAVEIALGTYLKKIPSGLVKLHVRASPQELHDIASSFIPAATIVDNGFTHFSFPPISDSLGKSYYLLIDTDGIPAGSLLTVYTSKSDIYPGGQFFVNDKATDRDMLFRAFDSGGGAACAECN